MRACSNRRPRADLWCVPSPSKTFGTPLKRAECWKARLLVWPPNVWSTIANLDQLREYRDEMDAMIRQEGDPDRFAEPDIDSFARYLDLNEAFHSEIVTLSKSSMLRRALEQVNVGSVCVAQRAGVCACEAAARAADVCRFARAPPLHRRRHRAPARHPRRSIGARTFAHDPTQCGNRPLRHQYPEWCARRVADPDPRRSIITASAACRSGRTL